MKENHKRKYFIFIGSKSYFDNKLEELSVKDSGYSFRQLIMHQDAARNNGKVFEYKKEDLILSNDNYQSLVGAAIERLGAIIEEFTHESSKIYIHNPPRYLYEYINKLYKKNLIELTIKNEVYSIVKDENNFKVKIDSILQRIIGQNKAVNGISKSLWYLTKINAKKPYVVMLYGKSSIGKTELVREIAKEFFDNIFFEKHLSMFKNIQSFDYLFGAELNRRSLGYDLLERESNLIFLDEFDKCDTSFYSAFYTLFDNEIFKDANYDVNMSGTLILLTANYNSLEDMKKHLGLPIFYRIDKFIKFEDFESNTIYTIVKKEISSRKKELGNLLDEELIYSKVSMIINTQGENARTIKSKVQEVIEELLFENYRDSKN